MYAGKFGGLLARARSQSLTNLTQVGLGYYVSIKTLRTPQSALGNDRGYETTGILQNSLFMLISNKLTLLRSQESNLGQPYLTVHNPSKSVQLRLRVRIETRLVFCSMTLKPDLSKGLRRSLSLRQIY